MLQGRKQGPEGFGAYLDEADVLGVAAEALPAAHEPILPDQPMGVSTDPAAKYKCIQS
mgnify:CR=1 FL=1